MTVKILTRLPSPNMAQAELTHLERMPIDMELAQEQHRAYCTALAATGAEIVSLPALDSHPDCTFVEDVLISLPELSILTRPGAVSRQGEVEAIALAIPLDRTVYRILAPGTVDGGDVLSIGKTLFVGLSTRTNRDGIAQLASAVRPHGYNVEAVTVPRALHLKTAVTALNGDLLLINPNWVDQNAFLDWHRIEVDQSEPFAGNSLRIDNKVFMQASHQKTAAKVLAQGFNLELIDISEFAKAEAGLTCLSVVIPTVQ
jgi:dimethylargininase